MSWIAANNTKSMIIMDRAIVCRNKMSCPKSVCFHAIKPEFGDTANHAMADLASESMMAPGFKQAGQRF